MRDNGQTAWRIEQPSRRTGRQNSLGVTSKGVLACVDGFVADNATVNAAADYCNIACSDGKRLAVELRMAAVGVARHGKRENSRLGIKVDPYPVEHGIMQAVEN